MVKNEYERLITHAKEKGITFNRISEEDVKRYIETNTYFFRIYSYRKNYYKNDDGKYINLDFAYLIEMSKMDRDLRYILFDLCIDVEYFLKKEIVRRVTERGLEREVVSKYFEINPKAKKRIESQDKNTSYTHNLIEKYKDNYPIWVFVEVASFGLITSFCDFYTDTYKEKIIDGNILNNIRDLRNAVAHNCCLLMNFTEKKQIGNNSIISTFAANCGAGKEARKWLTNKFIFDLTCLLYVHIKLINDPIKFKQFDQFLKEKGLKQKDYFSKNQQICSAYLFVKKVVDSILTQDKM